MLYLVPTPIGNLEDITMRALSTLKSVDVILAEDTRVTGKLLSRYEIKSKLQSFHTHNEHHKLGQIIERLANGENMALVSDAGSPGISDPGFLLTREAIANGIELTCLPGPTAVIPALVMSGIPCDKFYFEGFIPQKKGKQTTINFLLTMPCTTVFYESPHRILKSVKMIADLGGADRQICVSREISKMYEENIRGTVTEVIALLEQKTSIKGEIVVVMDGNKDELNEKKVKEKNKFLNTK